MSFAPHGVLFCLQIYCLYPIVLCSYTLVYVPHRVSHLLSVCLSHWAFMPHGVFYTLWRFIFLSFFLTPISLRFFMGSFKAHFVPLFPLAPLYLFFFFFYTWNLCATQGILYPWNLFPCGASCGPTGSVVPLLLHKTQIVISEFYVYTSHRYTHLHSDGMGGLSHHLNILLSVSTISEQVHMRMFDPTQLRSAVRVMCHIASVVCSSSVHTVTVSAALCAYFCP